MSPVCGGALAMGIAILAMWTAILAMSSPWFEARGGDDKNNSAIHRHDTAT
jgi:hypothetical protein